MAVFYTDISEAMNKQKFPVHVPEYYDNALPEVYKNGTMQPIYDPMANNICKSYMSSAEIVDMTVNKVTFEFEKFEDLKTVIDMCTIYNKYLEPMKNTTPDATAFYDKVNKALFILNKEYNRATKFEKIKNGVREEPTLLSIIGDYFK